MSFQLGCWSIKNQLFVQVPGLTSTWDMIMERGLAANIMLMPGRAFQPEQGNMWYYNDDNRQTVSIYDDIWYIMMTTGKPCQYLRAAFSIAPEQNFDPAMERLTDLIRCGQWTNTFWSSGQAAVSVQLPQHPRLSSLLIIFDHQCSSWLSWLLMIVIVNIVQEGACATRPRWNRQGTVIRHLREKNCFQNSKEVKKYIFFSNYKR